MNFYLIQVRRNSTLLYTEGEQAHPKAWHGFYPHSTNPIERFLARLAAKKSRSARALKNLIVFIRDTYYKLEYKIDPMERVFKRLRHASQLNLFYSARIDEFTALSKFKALLVRQRNKHTLWVGVDFLLSIIALALTPLLVPIPGPNVFLYYPALRMISHYLARKGTLRGLKIEEKSLVPLYEVSDLEMILNQPPSVFEFEKIRDLAQKLRLNYLANFLERYS